LTVVLKVIPVAAQVAGGDGSTFTVMHGAQTVTMSVASACSGANGLVGFLLVGVAFLVVVEGSRWGKLLWLATGALLVWILNVGRFRLLCLAAKRGGERAAIAGLHPHVGLVVFTLAVGVMVLLMRRFGLRLKFGRPAGPPPTDPPDTGAPPPPPPPP